MLGESCEAKFEDYSILTLHAGVNLMTDKVSDTLASIHGELIAVCSAKMREGQQQYFKESVKFLGCSSPQCNKIAGEWSKKLSSEGWSYEEVLLLAEQLLKAGS
jgi:hypothetical protein